MQTSEHNLREGEGERERGREGRKGEGGETYFFVEEVGSWLSLRNLRLFGGGVGEPASVEAITDSQRNSMEGLSSSIETVFALYIG